jgi:MFS family permease
MSEVITPRLRGRAVGSVQSGWAVGYGAAALLFTVVFKTVPPETAWRVLFLIGAVPAVAVLFMRGTLKESKPFEAARQGRNREVRVWEIFEPPLLRTTAVASLIAAGALGGNYTILTWLPTYLSAVRHLSVLNTGGYLAVNIAGSFCGYLFCAHLSDWLGRRLTFAISAVLAAVTVSLYTLGGADGVLVLLLGFPIGFFQSGIVSGMGASFAELYPTHVRSNGQGFSYNAGRGIGAVMPALVGFASTAVPLGTAIGIFAVLSYALVLVGTALLPETRGKELLTYE